MVLGNRSSYVNDSWVWTTALHPNWRIWHEPCHTLPVLDGGHQWMSLILYGLALFLGLNLIPLPALSAFFMNNADASQEQRQHLHIPTIISIGFTTILTTTIVINNIEKTIRANQTAPGEARWSLGNITCGLCIFMISVVSISPHYSPTNFSITEQGMLVLLDFT